MTTIIGDQTTSGSICAHYIDPLLKIIILNKIYSGPIIASNDEELTSELYRYAKVMPFLILLDAAHNHINKITNKALSDYFNNILSRDSTVLPLYKNLRDSTDFDAYKKYAQELFNQIKQDLIKLIPDANELINELIEQYMTIIDSNFIIFKK